MYIKIIYLGIHYVVQVQNIFRQQFIIILNQKMF